MARKSKDKSEPSLPKVAGLFDHVNHIRKVQSPDYYDQLSDADRKSFNHFMILKFLSMDRKSIEYIADIAKYFEIIPSKNFYQLCVAVTDKTYNFYPYIKSKSPKLNKELVQYVALKFEVSKSEASDYCKLLLKTENGSEELTNICRGYGLTDKEVEKIIGYE